MADIAGSYQSPYSSPYITTNISYSQTGRDSGGVSYHFNVSASIASGSSFGYSLGWDIVINGSHWSGSIKGNDYQNGPYTWSTSFDVYVPCGTGGGTLSATYNTTRPGGEGNSGKVTVSGTVNVSAYETAPYWGSATASITSSGIIPENTSSLTINWGGAGDSENNTRYYTVKRYVNGNYDSTIASNITGLTCTDNIGAGNAGYKYKYSIEVNDGSLWASSPSAIWTNEVTKNSLTPASISTGSSIGYSTTSIAFTISGASNTNGVSNNFSYSLACSQVTVYNPTATPSTLTIWDGSGNAPTGTYIKFADIKSATSGNNYVGTFTFTLTTTNGSYGSSGTNSCNVSVNIQTAPVPQTTASVTTSGYYTIGGSNYYIPNRKAVVLTWNAYIDKLGGSITYDIQANIAGAGFVTKASGITALTTSITLPAVSSKVTCVWRVVAKTSYGQTAYCDATSINLDYYNPPSIIYSPVNRTSTQAVISASIQANSSITGITVTSQVYKGVSGTNTTVSSPVFGNWSVTETAGTAVAYNFSMTVQDSAGAVIGTMATTQTIPVSQYVPIFSVREKGVGVNYAPDGTSKLTVGGEFQVLGGAMKIGDDVAHKDASLHITTAYGGFNRLTQMATSGASKDALNLIASTDASSAMQWWSWGVDKSNVFRINTGTSLGNQFAIDATGKVYIAGDGYIDIGANSTWGAMLRIGGNGHTDSSKANIATTNGNLHLDAKSGGNLYLNYYSGSNVSFGNGASGTVANVDSSGNATFNGTVSAGGRNLRTQITRLYRYDSETSYGYYIDHHWTGSADGWRISAHNDVSDEQSYIHITSVDRADYAKYAGGLANGAYVSNTNTTLSQGNGNALRVNTAGGGWVDIGPENTGYAHYYTDRPASIFNTDLMTTNAFKLYNGNSYWVNNSGSGIDIYGNGRVCTYTPNARGQWVYIDNYSSGSGGTEPTFRCGSNQFGFVGGSGCAWYGLYAAGYASVSQRDEKTDILPMDSSYMYDVIRDLKTYTYRHDGRDDFQMGVMVDESPLEVNFHVSMDAVDLYSYTTMVVSALQEAMKKIDALEQRIEAIGGV